MKQYGTLGIVIHLWKYGETNISTVVLLAIVTLKDIGNSKSVSVVFFSS